MQGNNEVAMWDMETGDRKFTLWSSSAPPLSEMQVCVCVCVCACAWVCACERDSEQDTVVVYEGSVFV